MLAAKPTENQSQQKEATTTRGETRMNQRTKKKLKFNLFNGFVTGGVGAFVLFLLTNYDLRSLIMWPALMVITFSIHSTGDYFELKAKRKEEAKE